VVLSMNSASDMSMITVHPPENERASEFRSLGAVVRSCSPRNVTSQTPHFAFEVDCAANHSLPPPVGRLGASGEPVARIGLTAVAAIAGASESRRGLAA
jgi:hypothetical protein